MEELTIEELCASLRKEVQLTKETVAGLYNYDCFKGETTTLAKGNVPADMLGNMRANITLAFRHLEDARMRLGKVMQASRGGISILDK